jgi:hypothetical protein
MTAAAAASPAKCATGSGYGSVAAIGALVWRHIWSIPKSTSASGTTTAATARSAIACARSDHPCFVAAAAATASSGSNRRELRTVAAYAVAVVVCGSAASADRHRM